MARNLTDIVDVVFVSDHGMTDTSHPELLYIDDILGEDGWRAVQHEDGEAHSHFGRFTVHLKEKFRVAFHGASL